jgi:hypothetical protein
MGGGLQDHTLRIDVHASAAPVPTDALMVLLNGATGELERPAGVRRDLNHPAAQKLLRCAPVGLSSFTKGPMNGFWLIVRLPPQIEADSAGSTSPWVPSQHTHESIF